MGKGVALNVSARIDSSDRSGTEAVPTTLDAGESTRLSLRMLVPSWDDTWGRVTYSDLLERQWETRFWFKRGPDGQIQIHVCAYGLASLLPPDAHPRGWEMPNGFARICLPAFEV